MNRSRQQRKRAAAQIPPAVHIVSLGCPKNLVDTELIAAQLGLRGFALADRANDADVLLVNTCGFIQPACEEARCEVRKGLRWKKKRRGRKLVVAGCWVQRSAPEIRAEFPEIDLLLDLNAVPNAGDQITQQLRTPQPSGEPPPCAPATYLMDHTEPRLLLTPPSYAYLKIADGCDHHCRFCTIPAIRGHQRSRTLDDLVSEAKNLLEQGVCELNLIAQDTTRYGHDLDDSTNLAGLLRALDKLPGDFWLRVLYTHPAHLDDNFIDALANSAHALPYVDLPLQHIDDEVLKAMGRRTPSAELRKRLDALRTAVPGLALRTTFLVGYPGETDEAFENLLAFVRETRFERLGCFAYCPEPGTPGEKLHRENPVPADLAEERRARILEAQQQIALENNRRLVDTETTVLLDAPVDETTWLARTAADAPDVDNTVRVTHLPPSTRPGFQHVRITDADAYDLTAQTGY